jgi:peptidyl-prolyl cis-trans isomerase-like 4
MQNVLIDDRRIHVDFSQSVSKLHGAWMAKHQSGEQFGGGGLHRKQKYRSEYTQGPKEYDMVFEHQGSRPASKVRPILFYYLILLGSP